MDDYIPGQLEQLGALLAQKPRGSIADLATASPVTQVPDTYAPYGMVGKRLPKNSPGDQRTLEAIGAKYKALQPFISNSTVIQSRDQGDGRQLEFYHPQSEENPVPGRLGFELFRPMAGQERENAIAADALHYLGGRQNDDAGAPVDPAWWKMKHQLWNSRSPAQLAMDKRSYAQGHERGQTPEQWAERNRIDAYVRGGVFPDSNPDWNRGPSDPIGWTPQQRTLFEQMKAYLATGRK